MDKTYLFQSWKKRGVIGNYDELYEYYHLINNCEKCDVLLNNSQQLTKKCLDHDHSTGLFRKVLCWECNINDQDRQGCKVRKDNTSGIKNISYQPKTDSWCFRRQVNKKTVRKYFKSKIDAICYKYVLLLKIKSRILY